MSYEFDRKQTEDRLNEPPVHDYSDYYRPLDELIVPVFEQAIEGGYIDQQRATALAAWLDQQPRISALYPFRQLRQALAKATAEGGWSDEVERGLLQFFAALPDAFQLVQLPEELFGDMYAAIFDKPATPLDMSGRYVEVTGPCAVGSHNAMYRIAELLGGRRNKALLRFGYLFVARSHIEARIISSKIAAAVASRMKFGGVQILAEEFFPESKSVEDEPAIPQRNTQLPSTPGATLQGSPDTIATLRIRYQDGLGETTERAISVTGYTPSGLSGLCHLRGQQRTFRFDKITECTDTATGRAVDAPHAYLRDIYLKSSRYSLARLTDTDFPILDILLHVAKADGQLREPERKVITAACKVFTHDLRITQEQIDDILGYTPVPSLHSFKIAVGRIHKLRDEAVKRKLLAACRTIIATQKTVTPGEQEALDYMVKSFAKVE